VLGSDSVRGARNLTKHLQWTLRHTLKFATRLREAIVNNKSDPTTLTAAECACRTGLTVRALRVYEDLGLISPLRTTSGWRYYGERELIRLNTITLLKSAGLTLAQIRTATNVNRQDPSLKHVLEMQVDAWKAKQADAARGQAIVEAALKTLHEDKSLSIDNLCNLVRSLEMSDQQQTAAMNAPESREIEVDTALLERYAGAYRYGDFGIVTITREGKRLFGQLEDKQTRELLALSESEFLTDTGVSHVRFVIDSSGPASSIVTYQSGVRAVATRVDADTVAEIKTRLAAKIHSQQPTPGSEAALRRILDGIATGKPNYDEMSSVLAQAMRRQFAQLQALHQFLGAVQSVEFQGVGNQGWDVYEVRRANGSGQWRITVDSNGVIAGASAQSSDSNAFSAVTSKATGQSLANTSETSAPKPGSEAALRRMIDGIRSGAPNYQEMSPLLAQSVRQQLWLMQTIANRLGGILAVHYKGSVTRHYDIFELEREHGSAQWRICLADDGTIAETTAMLTGSSVAAGP
jgi:DNA-binding transcriptional MerR regulator